MPATAPSCRKMRIDSSGICCVKSKRPVVSATRLGHCSQTSHAAGHPGPRPVHQQAAYDNLPLKSSYPNLFTILNSPSSVILAMDGNCKPLNVVVLTME